MIVPCEGPCLEIQASQAVENPQIWKNTSGGRTGASQKSSIFSEAAPMDYEGEALGLYSLFDEVEIILLKILKQGIQSFGYN